MSSTSGLASVSFAYPAVPGEVRAGLAARLRGRSPAAAFVLSTCLRIEVAVEGGPDRLEEVVADLFGPAAPGGRVETDEGSVLHLFRVAAGLDSPLVGEAEVWTQFRRAVAAAKEAGIGGRLTRVLDAAVATGRAARAALPGSPRGSLAVVAAEAVAGSSRVAVLGWGEMARAAVASLRELPEPPAVVVVARAPEKVGGVEAWGFDRAEEALAGFPAVISATSAKGRLVPDADLAAVLRRRSEPLILVDLAMPPDFRPPADAALTYVPIDALAGMVAERVDTQAAEELVGSAASEVWRRLEAGAAPLIAALYSAADEVVARTVERFAGRLSDPDDVRVLRQTAHTVARTLLAGPVGHLGRSGRDDEVASLIAEAFSLGPAGDRG